MAEQDHVIVGIHVRDRIQQAVEIQRIFTEFGNLIKTRLGLHELGRRNALGKGIILLEVVGRSDRVQAMIARLRRCRDIEVKKMVFTHP